MKPAARLKEFGQSAWLDLIGRKLIHSGELWRMVEEDGICGVTANPAIFEKAITETSEYDDDLTRLIEAGRSPMEIYETLAIADVRAACDAIRPLFDRLKGRDGFVSLEVSPEIARDRAATIAEAKRLWGSVDRPNVFIKIPANPEGIPAIREATAAGISVNITLIFSVKVYGQVIDAYLSGLEERLKKGQDVSRIHSVASFFVSRADTAVDKLLEAKGTPEAKALLGKIAVANAKEAYQLYLESLKSPRWKALEAKGATRQRPLWASTGTKNKAYSDALYVEPLIGNETVNTMPLATLHAFNDHGRVADTIGEGVDEARRQLAQLAKLGIDLEEVCRKLTDEGLELFSRALRGLLRAIAERSEAQRSRKGLKVEERFGKRREAADAGLRAAQEKKMAQRLWAKDVTLFGADPKHQSVAQNRLGWLDVAQEMRHDAVELASFAKEASQRFRHCVLLGMGGSSLCPDVLARIFGKQEGGLDLRVLDSTAPDAVRRATRGFDLTKTLFLVSSKSGTTTEVDSFYRHFRVELEKLLTFNAGPLPQRDAKSAAGSHFVAITDPGTPLHELAKNEGFWRTWTNPADIGGRYSALSFFGLVPAALLGLDVGRLLDEADKVALASGGHVPLQENLAVRLGAIAGGLARAGVDKLTLLLSPKLAPFGAWVEQLVAESTGKSGRGIVPVDGETLADPSRYGDDRFFVAPRLAGESASEHDEKVRALIEAGAPVVRWELSDAYALAGEFLRFEIATAVAGAVLDVDPFDEPNVTESKEKTKALLAQAQGGKLPPAEPALRGGGLALFCKAEHAKQLAKAAAAKGGTGSAAHWIAAHLALGRSGDYIALLAYLVPDDALARELSRLQGEVRDATRLATTLGFGPRFLHSTGQLHKGGAANGLFLQATSAGGEDLPIPGRPYGFATLFAAQARGDLEVLEARGRRALRVHIEDSDERKFLEVVRDAVLLITS